MQVSIYRRDKDWNYVVETMEMMFKVQPVHVDRSNLVVTDKEGKMHMGSNIGYIDRDGLHLNGGTTLPESMTDDEGRIKVEKK